MSVKNQGSIGKLEKIKINSEDFFKITDIDTLKPFFMSVVSESNHWLFLGSNGGISAGRINADQAIFPYTTDDKIIESIENTGPKTIFQIKKDDEIHIWEPFSERYQDKYLINRNLYKNKLGNKIIFEEINHDLSLVFSYEWNTSAKYGFIKKSKLVNTSEHSQSVVVLDGLQNLLPYGVPSDLQRNSSNLVNAYKRSILCTDTGVGIFSLSAVIVDKAEPSEALKANIAWSVGLDKQLYLLSSNQLPSFRKKMPIHQETDVKGEKGAYFVLSSFVLPPDNSKKWKIIIDVNQHQAQVISLNNLILSSGKIDQLIEDEIIQSSIKLKSLVAASDGIQLTSDDLKDARHYSNVLFNIMRGGIFDENYMVDKADFKSYLSKANKDVLVKNADIFEQLPERFTYVYLKSITQKFANSDFERLAVEYLPLKFSRRHGDPSRPWNRFSINTQDELTGKKVLDYEGNWRDIFQNWEALAYSYPEFIEGMIFKFVNSSTFDGYNPYRVTKGGFDWETIEPDNPWSYIGYWGDHQVIYLLKFLEFAQAYDPGRLKSYLEKDLFVYANVPYRIKSYAEILNDPKNTILFDEKSDHSIRNNVNKKGADGALLTDNLQNIYKVNLTEKLLAMVLAKLSNFIPEGGIWMNTQRPEWNDANNALVGNGISMVTLYYLRRFFKFFEKVINETEQTEFLISSSLKELYDHFFSILKTYEPILDSGFNDISRKKVTDALGQSASEYRNAIYNFGFNGNKSKLLIDDIRSFVAITLRYLEQSIKVNIREDKMYHAYNILKINTDGFAIERLDEMLEGQVAVLSSGFLNAGQALALLDSMALSKLYRKDQNSYLLYPNKDLPNFFEKNNIPVDLVQSCDLLKQIAEDGEEQIVLKDENGNYHFNGNFKNANDLAIGLNTLDQSKYASLVINDKSKVLDIWEKIFNHRAFTGRSGTFYGYEGLGSIYWHMVSKLHVAVQEVCLQNLQTSSIVFDKLKDHYYNIFEGIGVHKSPELYGAFPTDPYSHTPAHKGAQQPGMTGQVKEDILVRINEFGIRVESGLISIKPELLKENDLIKHRSTFEYIDINSRAKAIEMPINSIGFTYCQVAFILTLSDKDYILVHYNNANKEEVQNLTLDLKTSRKVFMREGEIDHIQVYFNRNHLK